MKVTDQQIEQNRRFELDVLDMQTVVVDVTEETVYERAARHQRLGRYLPCKIEVKNENHE